MRELGGASIQILDDVRGCFSYLAKTKFANVYPESMPIFHMITLLN